VNERETESGLYWNAIRFVGIGTAVSKTTSAPFRSRGLPGNSEATVAPPGHGLNPRSMPMIAALLSWTTS
jgi:hypothetical protein